MDTALPSITGRSSPDPLPAWLSSRSRAWNALSAQTLYAQRGWLLVGALLFVAAYPIWPLYHGAQNTYFLLGVVRAEPGGPLDADWLSGMGDHIPVFSTWVAATHALSAPWLSHVLYASLALVLGWSLYVVAATNLRGMHGRLLVPLFVLSLALLHGWRLLEHGGLALGDHGWWLRDLADLARSWTQGFNHHHLLRYGLLPSSFGVLLVAAIALHLRGRTRLGIVAAVAAATMHPSYILQAAWVVGGLLIPALLQREWRRLALNAALALVLVLPTVLFVGLFSLGDDPQLSEGARRLLIDERFPHHARLEVLFSGYGAAQLMMVLAALGLSWNCRPLRWVLLASILPSVALAMLAWWTEASILQMLMPWRTFVWILPVCSSITLAGLLDLGRHVLRERGMRLPQALGAAWLPLAAACLPWLLVSVTLGGPHTAHAKPPVVAAIASMQCENALFVVDEELHTLRLNARVPVYVDRVSHPYRASEVIEWSRRLALNRAFFEAREAEHAWQALMEAANPTHVVLRSRDRAQLAALSAYPGRVEVNGWIIHEIQPGLCSAPPQGSHDP